MSEEPRMSPRTRLIEALETGIDNNINDALAKVADERAVIGMIYAYRDAIKAAETFLPLDPSIPSDKQVQ